MSRKCTSCQHLKRPEIDRRLAAGEPVAQVARDHDLNPSSLHRHKTNCLKLALFQSDHESGGSRQRGHRPVALERGPEQRLRRASRPHRSDVKQAQQRSLNVAISGLNSIRQTLDSLARLAGHLQPASTQVNVAVQTNVNVGATPALAPAHDLIDAGAKPAVGAAKGSLSTADNATAALPRAASFLI